MGFIARSELAAAVSEAGGLGMIGSASLSPQELRSEIRRVRELTDRPFGVDIVVAQGYDGGGHTGRVGTLALVPAVLDAVDVPVMAAGGIGDGWGIAAVLAMGAVGAWIGTRFVASIEAHGHMNYKQRIVEIDDEGTTRTRCFSGKPCRMIRNQTTEAWESRDLKDRIQRFPKQFDVMSSWLGEDPYVIGRFDGRVETGALAAGQSSAVIHEVLPVEQIMQAIVEEADTALRRLAAG